MLGMTADPLGVGVKRFVVQRDAGSARQGGDHDLGCAVVASIDFAIDPEVDTRVGYQVVDDAHAAQANAGPEPNAAETTRKVPFRGWVERPRDHGVVIAR